MECDMPHSLPRLLGNVEAVDKAIVAGSDKPIVAVTGQSFDRILEVRFTVNLFKQTLVAWH